MTAALLQIPFAIVLAPAVSWWIKKMKAASQNRIGPSLVQVYSDLIKLFRKNMVISTQASWIFHAAPFVLLASTVLALCLVPVLTTKTLFGFSGDILVLIYVLALGRFFLALAALDTGTAFGGMGSSREMTLSSLAEAALLLAFFALAYSAQTLSLSEMIASFAKQPPFDVLFFTGFAFAAMMIIAIYESGRIPFDNPATHLELTMIHEAMILEYSGPYLGFIELAHALKQFLWLTLIVNLFLPWAVGSALFFILKLFILATVIGWIEIHSAKLRLFRIPDVLGIAFVLAVISLLGQLMVR